MRDRFLTAQERANPRSELPVSATGNLVEPRLWALPAYRLVYDPDGRPLRARRAGTW